MTVAETKQQNREQNQAASARAEANPTVVADAAARSTEIAAALAAWPIPGIDAEKDLEAPLSLADRKKEEAAWRAAEAAQSPAWRASVLSDLLKQRRLSPDARAIMARYGFHFDAARNAEAICKHLAALPTAPGSDSGLSLLTLVPQPVARNDRPDPLFPAILIRSKEPQGVLFSPETGAAHPSGQLDLLPGHGPGRAGGSIEPAPLLAIYDAGGAAAGDNNPAAPLASRIWLEGVLDVMPCDRSRGAVSLPPITTKELIKRLYPDHPGRRQSAKWRPNRMLPALLEALDLVDRHRVPILDREGHRTFWRIVSVTGRPGEHLDDALHLHVHFPPGSERGPLIDRHAVRIAGARSSAAWRLALSLSFRWHDPGRLILPVGDDRKWRQTRKPTRYPEVSDAELLALTFPAGYPGRKRDALTRAKAALSYLLKIGYAAVHPRQRIMPGKTWAGWNVPSDPLETLLSG